MPVEVLAIPSSFNAVTSAIEQQANREGLENLVIAPGGRGGRRAAEFRLLRHGELAGLWRLREVPQIYRVTIVIDDLGPEPNAAQQLLKMHYPLTLSILPHQRHSAEIAEEAYRARCEVMLHLPMEPEPGSAVGPGDGALRVGMSRDEVARVIEADLNSVPHAAGVNNHMGSHATADPALMAAVMKALAERRLFFVDSRTTAASVALNWARRLGIPAFYRSVFLDDTQTVEYTLAQLRLLRQVVELQGAALAIGHPYPTTLAALAEFLPEFDRQDIQLVPARELVRLPEAAHLVPPSAPSRQ